LPEAYEEIINAYLIGWAGSLLTTAAFSVFLVICVQSTKVKTVTLFIFSQFYTNFAKGFV
jgi:glucose-6-phosphate-specific signal transduction histidine kinase